MDLMPVPLFPVLFLACFFVTVAMYALGMNLGYLRWNGKRFYICLLEGEIVLQNMWLCYIVCSLCCSETQANGQTWKVKIKINFNFL